MKQTKTFEAIGTKWLIRTQGVMPSSVWKSIQQRIEVFDHDYSRFRSDSLVTQIARLAGTYTLPEDGYVLLEFYDQLYTATKGTVTPLIGQVMSDAGYDAEYSLRPKTLKTPPKWEDVISYDRQRLTVVQPVLLDFGAAGKGYLIDIIAKLLTDSGIVDFTINAGGDIRHQSAYRKKIDVGLENPFDTTEVIGIVRLGDQSLCASSSSRRKWRDFHHIISPETLRSVERVAATWVIADNTMLADGIATALFFTEPEQLLSKFRFTYAVLDQHSELTYAKDFPVKLFEAVA